MGSAITYLYFLIVSISVISMGYFCYRYSNYLTEDSRYPLITCIMITGKDASRERFARQAIRNFREQTYPVKHLVIMNHGSFSAVHSDENLSNVTEVRVTKGDGVTLGDIRNMAFDFVPYGGLFFVWDDDDYRAPDTLMRMYRHMRSENASAVCFTQRLEYDISTHFAWKTILQSGFVHVLAKKHYGVRYMSKESLEDINLLKDMRKVYPVATMTENDPTMYVRLVHGSNTSLYVKPKKTDIIKNPTTANWQETQLSPKERSFIDKVYLPFLQK